MNDSKASEVRFRRFLEKLPAGAYTCDREGQITYYNEQAVRLWGREPKLHDNLDRFCGSFKLFSADGTPICHDECWMALALRLDREFNGEEIIIERQDGSRLTVLAYANPIHDECDQIVGAVNVLVDISDRKRHEETMKQVERAKTGFLATLAHELRNPLAPIANAIHILRLTDDLAPGVERVCEIMEDQMKQLVRLVGDLLDVGRLTSGKIELKKDSIDLASIFASAVETSRPRIDAEGHQLAVSLPAEPTMLDADPVRLTQVIVNLLNNSAKYSKEGSQIWLTARRIGEEVAISVRDNGMGIPAEMLPRVFDMFSQSDRTITSAQGGLGIGLTLVKSFVEMHGGRVEAHSDGIDKGSEFIVHLPVMPAAHRAMPAAQSSRIEKLDLPRHRILVVDDARASSYLLGKLLEKLGQDVFSANNAAAALQRARMEPLDLVISDIGMPEISGYELATRLREIPNFDNTVLVALTGYEQESDRQRAREAGFDHYLVKPVSLAALQTILANLPRVQEYA